MVSVDAGCAEQGGGCVSFLPAVIHPCVVPAYGKPGHRGPGVLSRQFGVGQLGLPDRDGGGGQGRETRERRS